MQRVALLFIVVVTIGLGSLWAPLLAVEHSAQAQTCPNGKCPTK